MLFFWTDLDENSFFVLTALQGIKSLWSRTQANRRSHLAILASTSFYGDRMKEQALDKPADRFLQFWLHLHTNTEQNGCFLSSRVLRDWFQTSRETESVTVNDMFDFNSHQRQHIVKPCKKHQCHYKKWNIDLAVMISQHFPVMWC